MEEAKQKLKKWIDCLQKKKSGWIVAAGVVGIVFIFLSTFLPKGESNSGGSSGGTVSSDAYAEALEQDMEEVVAGIVGSQNVQVMITLDSGVEYVYAHEIRQDSDKVEDSDAGSKSKSQEKDSNEQNYVMVKAADGSELPLTVTEIAPRIKGVVVLCPGGGSESVSTVVSEAVTTALDIPSSKVCVAGIN